MAYESYCAACTYLNEEYSYRGYWCERKGEYHFANDAKCRDFCEAYKRRDSSRENMYDNSSNSNSGCYITTIICNILHFSDDNYYLNTLRKFRDNIMKPDPKYLPLLLTYDIIGPEIANKLKKDKKSEEVAIHYFDNYIIPAVDAIEYGKENLAIELYKKMTYALANRYNIDVTLINIDTTNLDTKYLGHGKVKVLKPNKEK